MRVEASTGSRLPSSVALLLRLTKNAATRQITPTTMAPAPRRERLALARPSEAGGGGVFPREVGKESAGSLEEMMAAAVARTAVNTQPEAVDRLAAGPATRPHSTHRFPLA